MEDWVFDSFLGFLKSPVWRYPVNNFIDQHCVVFDQGEESKFAYTEVFNEYQAIVEKLLESFVSDLGVTAEQIMTVSSKNSSLKEEYESLLEHVLAAEDFLVFKSVMVRRNISLEQQALQLMQSQLGQSPEAYSPSQGPPEGETPLTSVSQKEEEEARILEEVMRESKREYELQQSMEEEELEKMLALAKEESLKFYRLQEEAERREEEASLKFYRLQEEAERRREEEAAAEAVDGEAVRLDFESEGGTVLKVEGRPKTTEGSSTSSQSCSQEGKALPTTSSQSCNQEGKALPRAQDQPPPTTAGPPKIPYSHLEHQQVDHDAAELPSCSSMSTDISIKQPVLATTSSTVSGRVEGEQEAVLTGAGAALTGAEAAARWMQSARSELLEEQQAEGSALTKKIVAAHLPEDLRSRAAYLRRQRDHLLMSKKRERAQEFESFTAGMDSRGHSKATAQVARCVVESGGGKKSGGGVGPGSGEGNAVRGGGNTGILCSAIAERLKKEAA